jgi:hypothetical protein
MYLRRFLVLASTVNRNEKVACYGCLLLLSVLTLKLLVIAKIEKTSGIESTVNGRKSTYCTFLHRGCGYNHLSVRKSCS